MTQDVTRNLCARPALEIISKGRTEIIAWNQVVQGLKVLFNFAGIDVTEWKEAEPDMLELRLERGNQSSIIWFKPLARGVTDMPVFPVMVGAKFMACKPSATPHDDCEITYFYLPWECTAQDLIDIAFGEVTYPWIETVQNFSAAYAMSAPIERFPRCALVMLMDSSTKDDQRGSVYFKLWHQTENSVELLELEHTNSPFSAAEQAKQLGYSPTVYRCHSGCIVPFLPTSGFDFL